MADYKIRKAVIPAAGKGIRAYPRSMYIPKVMFEVEGRPILENTIRILRDQMGIKDIVIIVGYLDNKIKNYFGNGESWSVKINYVLCPNPDEGMANGILLCNKIIQEPFVCILGDEFYFNSNHEEICLLDDDTFAICAIKQSNDIMAIRRNYTVQIKDDIITKIIEKPLEIIQRYLGCGTYILRPEIFDWIKKTRPSPRTGRIEFMEVIDLAIQNKKIVRPFYISGHYFNINTVEDVHQCSYIIRTLNFNSKKISLVIPAYNEEKSIIDVINDFKPHVDEILVVDNCSTDNTVKVSREAGARVELVRLSGYGDTIRYGLDHASGDILVITEADYSFRSKDLGKFLEYIKDADMVIGTRTTRQLIEQGANMDGWLRLGNLIVAKLVEILWWASEPRFTDVGCTYRVIWKNVYEKIRGELRSVGPEFSLEMMIKMLQYKQRILEIPISYYPRLEGQSKHSRSWLGIFSTAFRMLVLVTKERFFR